MNANQKLEISTFSAAEFPALARELDGIKKDACHPAGDRLC
jgi:hypothetical protein